MTSLSLYKKADGPFYDHFEQLDGPERDAIVRKKLAKIIAYAQKYVPFYWERLEGLDPQDFYPLKKIPILKAGDLRKNLPPISSRLQSSNNPGYTVFQSGGTTGTPKTSLFTHTEMEHINHLNARGFYATHLTPQDRVANLWAVGGLYMTFIHMNRMLQEYGCTSFPFANHSDSQFILGVAKSFSINCFSGISSVVLSTLRMMNGLRERGAPPLSIEKIYYGGEHLYEADRIELAKNFGTKTILAPGYGTVDTWYLGYQCIHCPPGVFHAHEDHAYLEIIDEGESEAEDENEDGSYRESFSHCEKGRAGMLYATVLERKLTPIIRYRVGDRARWIDRQCPCGRRTKLFELLGRGDDVLRIGYDSVDYDFVQDVALKIAGLSGTIQMEKKRLQGRDQLIIRIETDCDQGLRFSLQDQFRELFLKERPSFSEFIKKETIMPLVVELYPLGTLPVNPRTGKLLRVKDVI